MKIKIIFLTLILAGFMWSCEDLDVEDLNHVGMAEVLGDPDKMAAYVEGSAYDFWKATEWSWPTYALACAGQTLSSSYTNYGGQDMNLIPRSPFANTTTYKFANIVEIPWQYLNTGVVKVNNIFKIINEDFGGVVIDSQGNNITNRLLASGYLGRALNLGHIGLLFDKAYIIREDTEEIVFSPWNEVMDAAIEDLESCISIAQSDNTVIFDGFNGVTLTAGQMIEFCNFLIANYEVMQARDEDDVNNLVDWEKVKTHAQNGLTFQFNVEGDGFEDWWSRILQRGMRPGSARTSWRMIKMMNPSKSDEEVPYPWPDGVNSLPQITFPDDARLDIDWGYYPSIPFPPDRGYWYWSTYSYIRYEYYNISEHWGPIPMYTIHENDLLYAEALIRTGGDKSVAAGIINETRVTRGGLTPMSGTDSDAELLRAITYERLVEHSWEGFAGGFFYRRVTTAPDLKLEEGQFYHLPIPAYELEIIGEPVYTFGGVGNEETPIMVGK